MKQIVLMSIQPQWVAKILNGVKTVEIRKTALHEGDEVHIYVTKKKPPYLVDYGSIGMPDYCLNGTPNGDNSHVNGKVVAKFIVGKVRKITHDLTSGIYFKALCQDLNEEELLKQSCLRWDELEKYLLSSKNDIIYALEITHLEIFDKPKELGEYKKPVEDYSLGATGGFAKLVSITHAPQSYQYAWIDD